MSAETMDGFALLFWAGLAAIVALALFGGIEWLLSRPSRRWIRRLRQLEHARIDWSARVIAGQCFYKQDK